MPPVGDVVEQHPALLEGAVAVRVLESLDASLVLEVVGCVQGSIRAEGDPEHLVESVGDYLGRSTHTPEVLEGQDPSVGEAEDRGHVKAPVGAEREARRKQARSLCEGADAESRRNDQAAQCLREQRVRAGRGRTEDRGGKRNDGQRHARPLGESPRQRFLPFV
jgi:hypothetical protein